MRLCFLCQTLNSRDEKGASFSIQIDEFKFNGSPKITLKAFISFASHIHKCFHP